MVALWRARDRTEFTAKARIKSTSPRAMPRANSPLPVSREIAVVMVRVCHLMLPPSIMETPTSEMIRP